MSGVRVPPRPLKVSGTHGLGGGVGMFTDSEVTPLKARLRHSRLAITTVAGFLTAFAALPAVAQNQRLGERVMIPTLQSSDKDLGVQAAEAIRNQLQKQTNVRDLVVVPKADINNSLISSGYTTTEALAPGEAKAVATLVRTPQYGDGTVAKTPSGYKIDARLIISRHERAGLSQPARRGGSDEHQADSGCRWRIRPDGSCFAGGSSREGPSAEQSWRSPAAEPRLGRVPEREGFPEPCGRRERDCPCR